MLFFIFVFILVGVFNTTKLSKTKLINLLNADKTVEGHLQNKKKIFHKSYSNYYIFCISSNNDKRLFINWKRIYVKYSIS